MMSPINRVRVGNFITQRVNLRNFCPYLVTEIHKYRGIRLVQYDYSALPNNPDTTDGDRTRYLVDGMDRDGYLADLVIHLADYWPNPEGQGGSITELRGADIHIDLFCAAQSLWPENECRPMGEKGFNLLADLQQEFREQWQNKNDSLFENILNQGPYEDVEGLVTCITGCKDLYDRIIKFKDKNRLIEARDQYLLLKQRLPQYIDTGDGESIAFLENESCVRKMQAIFDLERNPLIDDDRLPGETGQPYKLFKEFNTSVTPGSSMKEIQDELQKLKKKPGGVPKAKRDVLETLVKSADERLFVDAFLYAVCPSKESVDALAKRFFRDGSFPASPDIIEEFPRNAAALLFLLGRPNDAAQVWRDAHRYDPIDGATAHFLALVYLGLANHTAASDAETAMTYWSAAAAHWAVLLGNNAYWMKWGRQRFGVYQTDFVFTSINTLIDEMRSYLGRFLDDFIKKTRISSDLREKLKVELETEFEAVRMAIAIGGIDLGDGCYGWFGPLWVDQYRAGDALANHIAAFIPDRAPENLLHGPLTTEESLRRLRWYFSSLAVPAILLEGKEPNPRKTLDILSQRPNTGDCGDDCCPFHGPEEFPVPVCTRGDRFDELYPAYKTHNENGHAKAVKLMRDDALRLAISAHCRMTGVKFLRKKPGNLESLLYHYGEILELARFMNNPAAVRQHFRDMLLGESKTNPPDVTALDLSINIADIGLKALTDSYTKLNKKSRAAEGVKDNLLRKRLADLLFERGLKKSERDDIKGAEASLERALSIVSDFHRARLTLAMLWINQAFGTFYRDPFLAQDYLRRAEVLIREGETKFKGFDYSEAKTSIQALKQKMNLTRKDEEPPGTETGTPVEAAAERRARTTKEDLSIEELYGLGFQRLREKQPDAALELFEQAYKKAPDDIDIQKIIPTAVMEYGIKLTNDHKHESAINLVSEWAGRIPSQEERLLGQLEFLKRFPDIQPCLDEAEDFHYEFEDYREVKLHYYDREKEPVLRWVRVRVEEDYLSMSVPLPLFPDTGKEQAMSNLLQATNDILFKLSTSEKSEPILKCFVPFRLLEPVWFSRTAYDLLSFSSVSGGNISRFPELSTKFREIEAQSHQRHRVNHFPASARALEPVCRQRELSYERLTDDYYKIDQGRFVMQAQPNGTRLFTSLGPLPERPSREANLKLLIHHNSTLKQCKLSLDKDLDIILGIELPYLDEEAASGAFDRLEQRSAELQPSLNPGN